MKWRIIRNSTWMQRYFWKAYSTRNRYEVIASIESCVNEHGYIEAFQPIMQSAMSIHIISPANKLPALYECLSQQLSLEGEYTIEEESSEVNVFLAINFV